jgi:hypothetical protein
MKHEIRRITGVPIITITYDGTSEFKNDVIVPYLKLAVMPAASESAKHPSYVTD